MDDRFKPDDNSIFSFFHRIKKKNYLRTEKRRVEKARIAAIERIVIFNNDSCFSTLNRPNKGALITPLATAITEERENLKFGEQFNI